MTKKMTIADYERLLQANERELWGMTEKHARLAHFVQTEVWPRAKITMGSDLRVEFAEKLQEYGCEVEE